MPTIANWGEPVNGITKAVFNLGCCIVTIGLLVGSAPLRSQQLTEVTIGIPAAGLATSSMRIAKEMGVFAKNGIDPKFVSLDNASLLTQALISGSIQLSAAGPSEVITAQAKNFKVIVIGTTYAGHANTMVLSKAVVDKLGVSLTAPVNERLKALDGLVIAGTSPTQAGALSFKSASNAVGANIRFTYMAQPAMPAALESGAIQGFFSSAPFWTIPVAKGTAVVWISGPRKEIPAAFSPVNASVLETMRDFAESHPDLMKRLAKSLADFAQVVEERPADVKAAIARIFPELEKQTIDLFFENKFVGLQGKAAIGPGYGARDRVHEGDWCSRTRTGQA